jgi:hypothetical protein
MKFVAMTKITRDHGISFYNTTVYGNLMDHTQSLDEFKTATDHRMDRCHLKGSRRHAQHVLLCAEDYSIRWVLREGHQSHSLQQAQQKAQALWQKFAAVIEQIRLKSPA